MTDVRPRFKKLSQLALGCLLVALCLVHRLQAETPPPAGFPGGAETGQIPPPPTPEFEEDDFVDPGFGGFNNPNANGAPPAATNPGDSAPSYPAPTAGNSNAPRTNGFAPPPAARPGPRQSAPAQATAAGAKKAAPKLSDYLQLDSSVKALEVKNFDLPDKDIKDVVTLISKWTGKNFILDSKVRGKITILGPSQVTLQEAYQAFLSALDANGLTTVQSGKFIRIIESAEARRAPVETYAGDFAPKTDQFITRIFQLKYINSDEVQREFRDLTTRQGKLFAYEPTNSIIITDTGNNIARIEEILNTLDVKGFETTLHVLRIRNTSSKSISDMLGEIYGNKNAGANSGPRTFQRSALERTRGGGIISKIIPDEQTNSLVVLANGAGFEQLKQLVGKLDVKVSDTGRIHVYYCEYQKAEDLAATLQSLAGNGAGGKKKAAGGAPVPGVGGAAVPAPVAGGPVTAELDGNVKVTSDAATNSLVITANSGDYGTMRRVIRKLDIPRMQVYIESAILEVTVEDGTTYNPQVGVGTPGRAYAGGFVSDTNQITSLLAGLPTAGLTAPIFAGPTYYVQNPNGTGTIPVNSFMGFLNVITTNSHSALLSTPQILALDNEKAEFKVLDEIPVQTSVTALGGAAGSLSTGVQGNIDVKKVGITIKLTPHVNAVSRNVRLEIEQKVDSIKPSSAVPGGLQSVQIATTSRETNTSVVVKDQNYVMLGGLMSDEISESVKKVPLLGDIPIIGWLFKGTQTTNKKVNLVIVLHPRILGTSLDAANLVSEKMEQRDKFIDDTLSGDEDYRGDMTEIRRGLERQKRERPGPSERYRSNDDDADSPRDAEPTQESELDRPRPDPARQYSQPAAQPQLKQPATNNAQANPTEPAQKKAEMQKNNPPVNNDLPPDSPAPASGGNDGGAPPPLDGAGT